MSMKLLHSRKRDENISLAIKIRLRITGGGLKKWEDTLTF